MHEAREKHTSREAVATTSCMRQKSSQADLMYVWMDEKEKKEENGDWITKTNELYIPREKEVKGLED